MEFNKNLNIQTYRTWLKNYTGEKLHSFSYISPLGYLTKLPTLKYNGFKIIYDRVWGEVLKWKNQDIIIYTMSKHHIDKKSEVVYIIENEYSNNGKLNGKRIQLFHKKK